MKKSFKVLALTSIAWLDFICSLNFANAQEIMKDDKMKMENYMKKLMLSNNMSAPEADVNTICR